MGKDNLPQVDLFLDGGKASAQAKQLLQKSGITFQAFQAGKDFTPAPDFIIPSANGRMGRFTGVESIRDLIQLNTT